MPRLIANKRQEPERQNKVVIKKQNIKFKENNKTDLSYETVLA